MIIKSTTRKSKTFSQLLEYLLREKGFETNSWNMFSDKHRVADVIQEFMENAKNIDAARGSVFIYHEILALEKNNLSIKEQQKILQDLTQQYIQLRAADNLVYTVTHTDKKHIHTHLVISSNKVHDNKRMRLSKKVFNTIKHQLEAYKNRQYPQLKQTLFYDKAKSFSKSKRAEQEMKHKRNKQSRKEYIKEQLKVFFKVSQNETILKNTLESHGFNIYRRGKNTGVKYKNQSFRFSTLGLEKKYSRFLKDNSTKKQETQSTNQNQKTQQSSTSHENKQSSSHIKDDIDFTHSK